MHNHPNLKIKECNPKSRYCLVAFSSNGEGIENKFEFENICESKRIIKFFNKIIFVRDPKREFYINGIDDEISDVSKLIELVHNLTKGLTIRTIGYSSGGYMSILLSLFLSNIDRVIAPGGVINLLDWHGSYCNYNFSDEKVVKDSLATQRYYFNLTPMLANTNADVFMFYAGKAKSDKLIIEGITNFINCRYYITIFNTNKHGYYCKPSDYKYLLTVTSKKIKKVSIKNDNKIISTLRYSVEIQGIFRFCLNNVIRICRRIKRKIL